MSVDLSGTRSEYGKYKLYEHSVPADPFKLFSEWLKEAVEKKLPEPGAMMLSTVDKEKRPSARIVLLKYLKNNLLYFYTNYNSQKSKDITHNNNITALFFWPELERQLRIEGTVFKVPERESDEYFAKRPRETQIGAWSSPQSSVIPSMDLIKKNYSDFERKFYNQKVPRPKNWGGYYISPSRFEFWQGQPNRLNDRIVFEMKENDWKIFRLAP